MALPGQVPGPEGTVGGAGGGPPRARALSVPVTEALLADVEGALALYEEARTELGRYDALQELAVVALRVRSQLRMTLGAHTHLIDDQFYLDTR